MIAISNIEMLEYELEPYNVMIVHLKEHIIYKGYRTKELRYKITYQQFLAKALEWRRYNDNNR